MLNTKPCSTCEITKPLDSYGNDDRNSDGKQGRCKECATAISMERRHAADEWFSKNRVADQGNRDTAIRWVCEDTERSADTMLYLLDRIDEDPETGCYLWNKGLSDRGYAEAHIALPTHPKSNISVKGHRLMFALTRGFDQLPLGGQRASRNKEEMVLDHECGKTSCVNSYHLRVTTLSQNSKLIRQERVAPKGYGKVICADFADDSLLDLIARKSGVVK